MTNFVRHRVTNINGTEGYNLVIDEELYPKSTIIIQKGTKICISL